MSPLDPSQPALWWPNIRALAEVCAYVYTGPQLLAAPCEKWIMDKHTDAHALVQWHRDHIIIAFRGSKDPQDYIQDGKFEMADLMQTAATFRRRRESAKVHQGFLQDFEALDEELLDAMRLPPRGLPIFITGHSLGGALAILCALEFERQHMPVRGVITFGQPRVGNKTFCSVYALTDNLAAKTIRVVNANDIVPRVPPLLNGYRHTGQLALLLPQGGWKFNPSLWARAIADELGLWLALKRGKEVLLSDHHIGNYQKAIQLL